MARQRESLAEADKPDLGLETDQVSVVAEPAPSNFEDCPLIIVAEDVAMNMALIVSVLKQLVPGAEVVEATDGSQVLEITGKIKPDLILMDVQMPVMDGLEATMRIRKMEVSMNVKAPVPIVALSAGVSKEQKNMCLLAGMNEFLAKPVERGSLLRILALYLRIKNGNAMVNDRAAEVTGTDDHFDMQGLVARTGVDEKVLATLARKAAGGLSTHLSALTRAINQGNAEEVKRTAHTIKGVSLNLSFTKLARLARLLELEVQSQNTVTDALKNLYSSVRDEVNIIQRIFAVEADSAK